MKFITWNMQGAGGGPRADAAGRVIPVRIRRSSKWAAVARAFAEPTLDAMALQECGSPPLDLGVWAGPVVEVTDGQMVRRYEWQPAGPGGPTLYVVHLHFVYVPATVADADDDDDEDALAGDIADAPRGRVNIAIVSRAPFREIRTTFGEYRCALGVQHEGTDWWLFSAHASAAHGRDHEDLIANVDTTAPRGEAYVVLGDFNISPDEVALGSVTLQPIGRSRVRRDGTHQDPNRLQLLSTGGATHNSGAELDYCYMTGGFGLNSASAVGFPLSDHDGVVVEAVPAGGSRQGSVIQYEPAARRR